MLHLLRSCQRFASPAAFDCIPLTFVSVNPLSDMFLGLRRRADSMLWSYHDLLRYAARRGRGRSLPSPVFTRELATHMCVRKAIGAQRTTCPVWTHVVLMQVGAFWHLCCNKPPLECDRSRDAQNTTATVNFTNQEIQYIKLCLGRKRDESPRRRFSRQRGTRVKNTDHICIFNRANLVWLNGHARHVVKCDIDWLATRIVLKKFEILHSALLPYYLYKWVIFLICHCLFCFQSDYLLWFASLATSRWLCWVRWRDLM